MYEQCVQLKTDCLNPYTGVEIQSEMEVRDIHEAGSEPQNMSVDDNCPGFESMGDEVDGAGPLEQGDGGPPVELPETVSN